VSTAIQENFGISIVEAVRCGCYPLLPNNLSYPELIPEKYHTDCLYNSQEELEEKLSTILATPGKYRDKRGGLASHMETYSWELVIDKYDKELEELVVY
jgi:glycosyltransferase involved in cell wall biosynthesis